jgi:hypothetical protein
MVEAPAAKRHLSEGLPNSRTQLRDAFLLLRQELDLRGYLVASIRSQTFEWIITAFIAGWLLSRLPARKKKIYYSLDEREAKAPANKTRRKLWRMVWDTSKPIIAAYVAKGLTEKATPRGKPPETEEGKGDFVG